MLIEVKVPQLSESVSEATLLTWHKKAGEAVAEGENLIDLETDKVVLELPATKAGVLTKIIKQDGEQVTSLEVIAIIDTDAKASVTSAATGIKASAVKVLNEKTASAKDVAQPVAKIKVDSKPQSTVTVREAEPAVAAVAMPSTAGRIEQRVPMTRIRQRIAERLLQSQQNAAILTTFNEVNMQSVIELRNRYKELFEKKHGIKLGFMAFFVKAAVSALQKFPVVNASVDGTDIIYHGYYDIGVAIGSERGLVVPIIRDADKLSLADIEKQIAEFSARGKEGKITLAELTGGTFSISNGGVFGSMLSTPIINPPQSAILGIHATKDRPVAENGQVVIRPMNYLALSYDHRIVDGRDAVLFLGAIKEYLEFPGQGLLDL
ncbi:MAG: dihydrolipoyllysine-residue succinyltransferase [Candidatus Nitrotoga sp.]